MKDKLVKTRDVLVRKADYESSSLHTIITYILMTELNN